jgi:hypothetical protein
MEGKTETETAYLMYKHNGECKKKEVKIPVTRYKVRLVKPYRSKGDVDIIGYRANPYTSGRFGPTNFWKVTVKLPAGDIPLLKLKVGKRAICVIKPKEV